MNDIQLDTRLVAATNRRSDDTNTFVKDTMQKIRTLHAADEAATPTLWQKITSRPLAQRFALGALAAVMVSAITFTGYAYAIGSDPISLIKRWVEGDKVNIEYNGRHFEHGVSRNYSDAAVTALAEANTVEGLAFRAKNALQTPKDGVEYVNLPPSMAPNEAYQYPYFATITAVNAQTVTLHKQYIWGDKMNPSRDINETQNIPAATFRYYAKGEPASPTAADVGKLIMVHPETAIRHTIGTNKAEPETNYFSFALSHSLESFKEVARKDAVEPGKDMVIYEPNWGGLSDVCLNNGADTCDLRRFSQRENQGFYRITKGPGPEGMASYNQDAIAQGEGVGPGASQPDNIVSRNIMGTISAMDDTYVTVKTSSGATWRFAYSKDERAAFAAYHKSELKIGDKLAGQMLESIYNLDNRTIDHRHIKSLERYQ